MAIPCDRSPEVANRTAGEPVSSSPAPKTRGWLARICSTSVVPERGMPTTNTGRTVSRPHPCTRAKKIGRERRNHPVDKRAVRLRGFVVHSALSEIGPLQGVGLEGRRLARGHRTPPRASTALARPKRKRPAAALAAGRDGRQASSRSSLALDSESAAGIAVASRAKTRAFWGLCLRRLRGALRQSPDRRSPSSSEHARPEPWA